MQLLKSRGLDVPQSTDLANDLADAGYSIDRSILGEEECADALAALLEAHGTIRQNRQRRHSTMSVIKLDHVSYVYSKGTPFEKVAVNDVNVEIEKGEFVGVIGHTGSGKSTLVQHLNALLAAHLRQGVY